MWDTIFKTISEFTENKGEVASKQEDCLLEKNNASSLLDCLQNDAYIRQNSVTTVCTERQQRNVYRKKSSSLNSTQDTSNLSLDGSPLKLQQFDDINDSSTTFDASHISNVKPFTTSEARSLLSSFTKCACAENNERKEQPPLFVYCDGTGSEALAFLGVSFPRENDNEKQKCITYKISTKGPFPHKRKDKLPKISSIANRYFAKNCKVNTRYRAEYDVMGCGGNVISARDLSIMTPQSGGGSLTLKVEWNQGTALLQTPPLDAQTTVEAVIYPGDMRSAAHNMYTELSALQGFTAGLAEGLVKWAVESTEIPLLDRVQALIDEVKRGDGYLRRVKNTESQSTAETPIISLNNIVLDDRHDLDFTEQLWNILKDCSSYSDLVQCLELIFKQLEQGLLQPMVHKSNVCTLAKLIRASYKSEMVTPNLTGRLPLELLIEIGIEKLQRDYQSAFIGKEFAAASHMEYFVTRRGSLEERTMLLNKLHHTLELIAMLSQYLNLPKTTLGITARRTLKHYETHEISSGHVFSVPVSTSHIYPHIERSIPRRWQLDLSGEVDGTSLCAVYVITQKPLFSHTNSTHCDGTNSSLHDPTTNCDGLEENEDTSCRLFLTVASQHLLNL